MRLITYWFSIFFALHRYTRMNTTANSSEKTTIQDCYNSSNLCESNDTNAQMSAEAASLYATANMLMVILGPILLVGGVTCNTVALIVLQKKKLNLHFSTYLSALAICDSIFLICSLTAWIMYTAAGINLPVTVSCNMFYILHFYSAHLSSFILVALSFDRFCMIYFPTRKFILNKPKHVIPILGLLVIVGNWHMLGGLKEQPGNPLYSSCKGKNTAIENYHTIYVSLLDSLFYTYAPSVLIICLNTLILVRIYSRRGPIVQSGFPDSIQNFAAEQRRRREDRVTRAAITVTFVFVLLTLPLSIDFLLEPDGNYPLDHARWYLVAQILNVIMHLNHCVNILLYCLVGPSFRAEFCKLFMRKRVGPLPQPQVFAMQVVQEQG